MGSDATGVCFASGKIKIPCQTGMGRNDFHQWDKGNAKLAGLFTQPSIAFHKGSLHYVQRVRITSSRVKPFVCHTTPHFDSTSREVSYSVHAYHTRKDKKCKSPIPIFSGLQGGMPRREAPKCVHFGGICTQRPKTGNERYYFVHFDEKTLK